MCKVSDAVCELTPSERVSLGLVGTGSYGKPVPVRDVEKFLKLGFVEVVCGQPEQTPFGRRAVSNMAQVA